MARSVVDVGRQGMGRWRVNPSRVRKDSMVTDVLEGGPLDGRP
jgi:hypothetical protein